MSSYPPTLIPVLQPSGLVIVVAFPAWQVALAGLRRDLEKGAASIRERNR